METVVPMEIQEQEQEDNQEQELELPEEVVEVLPSIKRTTRRKSSEEKEEKEPEFQETEIQEEQEENDKMKEMSWKLIHKYFEDNPNNLVAHHLESYNDFIAIGISQIFKENNPIRFSQETKQSKGVSVNDEDAYDFSKTNKPASSCKLYMGGKDGNKIYFGKPVIYDKKDSYTHYMYPNDARLRSMTYGMTIHYDVHVDVENYVEKNGKYEKVLESFTLEKIYLGKFPIMLQSNYCILNSLNREVRYFMGECRNDYGGYFIIDGKEKVIVSQEKFADNQIAVKTNVTDPLLYQQGENEKEKANAANKYICYASVKSVAEDASKPKRTTNVMIVAPTKTYTNRQIVVDIPNVKEPVPLFIVMRALGVISDQAIIETCLLDIEKNASYVDLFIPSVHDAAQVFTQTMALNYIALLTKQQSVVQVLKILSDYFLPHMGDINFLEKAYYLGNMVYRLLRVYVKVDKDTNIDEYNFKRIDTTGTLLYSLFSEYYAIQKKLITLKIDAEHTYHWRNYVGENFSNLINNNQIAIFSDRILEEGVMKAFKGKWGSAAHTLKVGLVQDLNRLSWYTHMSHLRKVSLPIDSSAKVVGPRLLNNSQWGLLDPFDTPDGGSVGLDKHLSILTRVSRSMPSKFIIQWLNENTEMKPILQCNNPTYIYGLVKIFVNGAWIGVIEDALPLVKKFKLFRRNGLIDKDITIFFNYKNEINIQTDGGRLMRPLYFLDKGKVVFEKFMTSQGKEKITWSKLTQGTREVDSAQLKDLKETQSAVEYLDTQEQLCALIARKYTDLSKNKYYTHLEIDGSTILGVMGNLVIYPDHNPIPRNAYSCSQSKQAVSMYHSNYQNRMDKMGVVLNYGQIPIVKSRYMGLINHEEVPYGVNTIVAIMSYTGYNVEDAVLINEGSIHRGLFKTTYLTTYEDREESSTIKKMNKESAIDTRFTNIEKKLAETKIKLQEDYDYSLLDADGFIKENEPVNERTVLIGKVVMSSNNADSLTDASVHTKKGQQGYVDKVFVSNGEDGFRIAKVRIRHDRMPKIGDKMASRSGQKGTIGRIIAERDMPFTAEGVRPDIIINPHAIPSRMTLGQIVECLFSKTCVNYGAFGECTAFMVEGPNYTTYGPMLTDAGFHSSGNEILYDALSGEQLDADIFIGPTYYMRLKHMVEDKINYRSHGPNQSLTKQPLQGRANDGGLRIGEMERDGILGHGMSKFLNESFMERSGDDHFNLAVCNKTGAIAVYNEETNLFFSPFADGPVRFTNENKMIQSNGNITNIHLENVSRFGRSFSVVRVPYTFKLLMQELGVMNIQMRIITDDNVDQLMSLSYSNNIKKLLKEPAERTLKETVDEFVERTKGKVARMKTPSPSKESKEKTWLKDFIKNAKTPYFVRTLNDAIDLVTNCFKNIKDNINFQKDPVIQEGLSVLPPEIKGGPWLIDKEVAENTMAFIYNILHLNSYMLCVLNEGVRLVKLTPGGYPEFLNSMLPDDLQGKDLRMFGCRIKDRQLERDLNSEGFNTQVNDWILSLDKNLLPKGLYVLVLTDAVIIRKDKRYPWQLTNEPEVIDYPSSFLPVLSFSGSRTSWDIPIPNQDDIERVITNEDSLIQLKQTLQFNPPFSEKKDMAVFRGTPTGCGVMNTRVRFMKYFNKTVRDNPDVSKYFDVGLTKLNAPYRYDKFLKKVEEIKLTDMVAAPEMRYEEQSKYKYIIHIDGNVAAYRLATTMLFNSVILKVDGEYTLWYEQMLNVWDITMNTDDFTSKEFHCIRIDSNFNNLIPTIMWCNEHEAQCAIIAQNALKFANMILNKDYLNASMQKILWGALEANRQNTVVQLENIDWSSAPVEPMVLQESPIVADAQQTPPTLSTPTNSTPNYPPSPEYSKTEPLYNPTMNTSNNTGSNTSNDNSKNSSTESNDNNADEEKKDTVDENGDNSENSENSDKSDKSDNNASNSNSNVKTIKL